VIENMNNEFFLEVWDEDEMVNDFIGQSTFFLNIDKHSFEKKDKVI